MNQETSIAIRDESPLTLPSREDAEELIDRATYIADRLSKIVADRQWFATVQGKRYLEVEAWQFIGFQANINADIEYTRPIHDADGAVVAYESKAVLSRGGMPFSSGIMECGMDSFPTRGKQGREKDKAAQSASQTWAISKAYRNRLSFIAKMAGFEPTPADEMRTSTPATPADPQYMCPEHGVEWFKRGRMNKYAHPIEGTKSWCNMDEYQEQMRDSTPKVDEDGVIQDDAPPPAFKNKGEVMSFYRERYGLTTQQISAQYPEGTGLQELSIEDVVAAAEKAAGLEVPY